jgi:hypothetical protein
LTWSSASIRSADFAGRSWGEDKQSFFSSVAAVKERKSERLLCRRHSGADCRTKIDSGPGERAKLGDSATSVSHSANAIPEFHLVDIRRVQIAQEFGFDLVIVTRLTQ